FRAAPAVLSRTPTTSLVAADAPATTPRCPVVVGARKVCRQSRLHPTFFRTCEVNSTKWCVLGDRPHVSCLARNPVVCIPWSYLFDADVYPFPPLDFFGVRDIVWRPREPFGLPCNPNTISRKKEQHETIK
ncbi:unnamed protein product, partial [Ixodes persulcatus]